jgi:hypothetical protein
MLPLQSKTTPTESGASSLENCVISCGCLSSVSLKFSFSSPVTKRFMGSVTVTGISTSVLSTRMLERGRASASHPVWLRTSRLPVPSTADPRQIPTAQRINSLAVGRQHRRLASLSFPRIT